LTTAPVSASADRDVLAHAESLAECALAVLGRRYPHKLDHLILDEHDQRLPVQMHPVFDGCFDWHSSVHMHWSLLRLRVLVPDLARRDAIAQRFDAHFTPELVERELAYLCTPGRAAFERPYGWAWLLKLQAELHVQAMAGREDAARWAAALAPLAGEIVRRLAAFLTSSGYPVRAGTHPNSAFAMLLARDHALATGHESLRATLDGVALSWFGTDTAWPAAYEPGGTDFLSPGLCEALLMRRVLGEGFGAWWSAFRPAAAGLERWCVPATVSDRGDGQLVHLDGLNLARAWCLRALAPALEAPERERFMRAADAHWQAAWPHVTGGDFVATHWLVSFALLR
jgi:hypothetical protein